MNEMNLILENTDQVKFFTNMKDVFLALGDICLDYDWYVSDIETNGYLESEDTWFTGEELFSLITKNDIQFIWAMFSAFEKGQRIEINESPYIYDNPDYWNGSDIKPQLNHAKFEIACWDSSATILVGLDQSMASKFIKAYSDTVDLVSVAR